MDFKSLLDYAKSQAILNTLESNEVSVWRAICRSYSSEFSTPLHLCLDGTIPPEDILLAFFESQLKDFDEDKDLGNLLDQIYRIEDPDYDDEKEAEVKAFMKKAAKEEAERIRLGKPIHKAMKNEATLEKTSETPKLSSGSVDFSHLEEDEDGRYED